MKFNIIFLSLLFCTFTNAGVELKDRIINFNQYWSFEIGDDLAYAEFDYDDSQWEEIYVPSSWEDEGFPGYDGYAWYRLHFTIDHKFQNEILYLHFASIDDVDETYINGNLVGYKGSFPPNYVTQAPFDRLYQIPKSSLNFGGDNVIAIRVFDLSGTGGIIRGRNGIYTAELEMKPEIEIPGFWKFKTGDNIVWKNSYIDDSDWDEVPIPSEWGFFGLKDYDGFAWYRKKIFLDNEFENENLILLLGKIDDMDETFINGEKIGGTGRINDDPSKIYLNQSDHITLRAYLIPRGILKFGAENTIVVRVYDGETYGGIYEGPIGIVTRETYKREIGKSRNNLLEFLKSIFK